MGLDLGRHSIVEWAESAQDDGTDFTPAQEKFLVEMPIGKGGMGEVLLVTDQDLKRQVAMKVLRRDIGGGRDQRLHFIAEAQATSQLEHPGIPPVHDIGLTRDGQLYFTMKLIQGRTLGEVLHGLALKRREVQKEFNLHKLATVLERICEALHFSHERGVIHRDLKPENIMLGDYGEVHVMDWGLARVERSTDDESEFETVETARTEAGLETQHGAIKGTFPYMSPEQLQGDTLDRRSDLYAVGCLLYEMLTLHAAFESADPEFMSKKLSGEIADVRTRNPRRKVPEPLAAICAKALATDKADRYATAEELAGDLRRWLDGRAERERRHREAEELAARGGEASRRYVGLRGQIRGAELAADAEEKKYKLHQPVAEKRSAIEARRKLEDLQVELALAFAEAQKLLDGALLREENNENAQRALAQIWNDRLENAERRRDRADIAYARVMVEQYAGGPLKEEGRLWLRSEPSGAEVLLFRYVERDGVLQPEEERSLGAAPVSLDLDAGSYLCILKKDGYHDTRYPVRIDRATTWQGEVKLRSDEEIGDEFVYVPKGPFLYGEGKDTTTKTLDDFAIAKYPVTFGEYAVFMDALGEEEAKQRCPRTDSETYMQRAANGRWRIRPGLLGDDTSRIMRERHGESFEDSIPVFGVSWNDALAYCKWKGGRLPTEEEREKATRGVDGRRFAWGDLEDASLGKCRDSRPERTQPEPVGAFPTSESVYGMGDASGGVWDWTDSWYDERELPRVLRGGSWKDRPVSLRSSDRNSNVPAVRGSSMGFRIAKDL